MSVSVIPIQQTCHLSPLAQLINPDIAIAIYLPENIPGYPALRGLTQSSDFVGRRQVARKRILCITNDQQSPKQVEGVQYMFTTDRINIMKNKPKNEMITE